MQSWYKQRNDKVVLLLTGEDKRNNNRDRKIIVIRYII